RYGIIGPAIANLISFCVYNYVRYLFLWKKFNLQPFSKKTAEVILLVIFSYGIAFFIFRNYHGIFAMIGRTALFALLFLPSFYYRNISPDVKPVIHTLLNRFTKK
ncbi:MAG: polysaccharide biosynthesis C-terminal domain-containing protein, partial [Bacteroidetes bacterium]|nr:polysaccharide biosynthesis C-terminal domain-containing protein [Bacteroidota bacterium]